GGVDKLVAPDINAHVGGPLAAGAGLFEQHQIAGLQLTHGDGGAVVQLVGGGAVEGDAELGIDIGGEAGAVKAAGAAAAVHIGIAHKGEGVIGNLTAQRGAGRVHNHGVFRADVAGVNLVPAVALFQHLDHGAGGELVRLFIVGARTGADVQSGGGNPGVYGLL